MSYDEPIHVTVPGCADDPRIPPEQVEGIIIHRVPELHPDDVVTMPDGLRVTSVARTLIDCAEECSRADLRAMFRRARALGLLDMDDVEAALSRVEWRQSLEMFYEVMAEFE